MTHFFRRACLLTILLALTLGVEAPTPLLSQGEGVSVPDASQTQRRRGDVAHLHHPTPLLSASEGAGPPPGSATRSNLPGGANVAIIPIEGMIYDFTLDSLRRRIDRAVQNGATVIVLELDTYGGVVTSALDIAKYLKDPAAVPVPVLAWVHNKAYSAGILIAAACDQGIVMSSASATGDCAPIVPGRNLAPTERAKAFSPIASEFQHSAATHGYSYATFHAMCVLGVELYLIERTDPATGQAERRLVNQADYAIMVRGDTNAWQGLDATPAPAPGGPGDGYPPALPAPTSPSDNPGSPSIPDIPTLPGGFEIPGMPELADEGAPAPVERVNPAEASAQDVGQWQPVTVLPSGAVAPNGRVHDGQTLFTPDETRAADVGLSRATVSTDAELQQYLQAASVSRIDQTWSENFAGFLTRMWVRAVLVVLLALGVYLELQSPGLGIPAAVAALALFGLFGAPMVIGLADVWHILLFVLGLGLLIVELMFTPTFGALGIVGVILMLAALVLSAVPITSGGFATPGTWDRLFTALLSTLTGTAASFVGIIFLTRYFGQIPGLSRLVLADAEPANPHESSRLAGHAALGDQELRVGDTGRVASPLRPAGTAVFHGRDVDVTSTGSYLDTGTPIRIAAISRFTITVEEM